MHLSQLQRLLVERVTWLPPAARAASVIPRLLRAAGFSAGIHGLEGVFGLFQDALGVVLRQRSAELGATVRCHPQQQQQQQQQKQQHHLQLDGFLRNTRKQNRILLIKQQRDTVLTPHQTPKINQNPKPRT